MYTIILTLFLDNLYLLRLYGEEEEAQRHVQTHHVFEQHRLARLQLFDKLRYFLDEFEDCLILLFLLGEGLSLPLGALWQAQTFQRDQVVAEKTFTLVSCVDYTLLLSVAFSLAQQLLSRNEPEL